MKGIKKNKNRKTQANKTMKMKKHSTRRQRQKGGKTRKKTKHSAFKRSIFFPFFRE